MNKKAPHFTLNFFFAPLGSQDVKAVLQEVICRDKSFLSYTK